MAVPTRPRNSKPFMATSPYPSARYYLGLNVHDFNLTQAEFSSPHRHGGIRAVVCGKRTHTSAGSLALLDDHDRVLSVVSLKSRHSSADIEH